MVYITEPARDIKVINDVDIVVLGALRVMISLNQTGEAAGVACYEALTSGKTLQKINFESFRDKMKKGGSIIL